MQISGSTDKILQQETPIILLTKRLSSLTAHRWSVSRNKSHSASFALSNAISSFFAFMNAPKVSYRCCITEISRTTACTCSDGAFDDRDFILKW